MSLVTLIRDYVDVANSREQLDGYTLSSLSSLAYHTLFFLFTVAKQALVYCFTFHWLRDLSYFCFTPSSLLSSFANVGTILSPELTNVIEMGNQPFSHLLAFSDLTISTGLGILFLGFLNGCLSSLHLSAAHLVTIQRLLVQGVPAGLCSAFGTALGQFLFLACILFGFRGLLFPWLSLEPLQFLLGTGILLSVASSMAQDRRRSTIQWSAKSSLFFYFCTNATLAWCEQAALFQWMGNISLGAEPTFLESTPSFEIRKFISPSTGSSFVSHLLRIFTNVQESAQNIGYLIAFFLGSVLGAFLVGLFLQRFLEFVLRYKGVAVYYGLIKQANLPLATFLFAFGFGSMPYYGFDYLVTKGFGFLPHESVFKQTLFSPINLVSKTSQAKDSSQGRLEDQLALLFTLEGETSKSFAVDTTPFDQGQYLKSNQKRPQAFEDLNYRGEHLWTNRLSRISNIREQANQTQSSFLGPVFSWMRSFLWGDGPATVNSSTGTSDFVRETSDSYADDNLAFLDGSLKARSEDFLKDQGSTFQVTTEKSLDDENLFRLPEFSEKTKNTSLGHSLEVRKVVSTKSEPQHEVVEIKKELSLDMEQGDNYLKEFDRQFDKGFSNFYDADSHSLIEVEDQWQEKRIKEKCYTNPIYTFLLNTEIDAFLGRQPKSHWLSAQEEILLLKRRQLLANYYDTLALTSQVATSEGLEQLVPKSYGNAIYNHQFKGTLKVARRLFSVKKKNLNKQGVSPISVNTVNTSSQGKNVSSDSSVASVVLKNNRSGNEQEQSRIVKFDQPLFSKETKNTSEIVFHEELRVDDTLQNNGSPFDIANKSNEKTQYPVKYSEKGSSENKINLEKTQVQEKEIQSLLKNRNFHLKDRVREKEIFVPKPEDKIHKTVNKENIFSLEQAESTPLYAGWDEEIRKFVLTNRFQSRAFAGYTFSQYPIAFSYETGNGLSEPQMLDSAQSPRFLNVKSPLKSEISDSKDISHISNNQYRKGDKAQSSVENTSQNHLLDMSGTLTKNQGDTLENNVAKSTFFTTWPIPNPLGDNLNILKNSSSDSSLNKKQYSQEFESSLGDTSLGKSYENGEKSFLQELSENLKPGLTKKIDFSRSLTHKQRANHFLFRSEPATNDMVNALLQWQKVIKGVKEEKQLSKEDKQVAKERVSYWPNNLRRANWSTELIDNEIEFDEPPENIVKKKLFLWEFTPPYHGGFIWSGTK